MAKVRKAYRLAEDLVSELGRYCDEHDLTATDVVERAIALYIRSGPREAHTEEAEDGAVGEAVRALTEQLRVKDEQIERLGTALSQAQSLAHAAQALEGAQVARTLGDGGGDGGTEHRKGIVSRLMSLFR